MVSSAMPTSSFCAPAPSPPPRRGAPAPPTHHAGPYPLGKVKQDATRLVRDAAGIVRTGPSACLESRKAAPGPTSATSTQVVPSALRLLLRQRAVLRSSACMLSLLYFNSAAIESINVAVASGAR